MGRRALYILIVCLALCGAAQAQTEQRQALVIGNQAYSGALTPLRRPHQDISTVGSALSQSQFAVTSKTDLSRSETLKEIRGFADRLKKAGPNAVGFFYYSGHGASAQVGSRRRNFLIPARSSISQADELVTDGVALDDVVALLEQTGSKAVFIVFDACRTELPWSKGGDDADKAFNSVSARPGMFIAFATDAGASAPDDGAFADALSRQLLLPGRPHLLAFDAAARSVGRRRGTDRLPWYSNQIADDIYFVSAASPLVSAATAPAPSAPIRPQAEVFSDARTLPASSPAPVLARGQKPRAFQAFRDCADCVEMVALPGGRFTMGSPEGEKARKQYEDQVSISLTDFAISRFPVTRGEYAAFATATGRKIISCQPGQPRDSVGIAATKDMSRYPIDCVSWDDAVAFASWMKKTTGQSYRLVSDPEYEYANRAGQTTQYFWGSDANDCRFANGNEGEETATSLQRAGVDIASFTYRVPRTCNDSYKNASPVGSLRGNAWGLYDTTGNVWSWTDGCHAYQLVVCTRRIFRGGSWRSGADELRAAMRGWSTPNDKQWDLGFRLARSLR